MLDKSINIIGDDMKENNKEYKEEKKPELPKVSGDKATIKASLPFLSVHEFDGVKYQVTAVLKGGIIELTRQA